MPVATAVPVPVPVPAREDRSWVPLVERGCCCSLEACCKVQAILVVAMSLLFVPNMLIEYLQPQPHAIRCPPLRDKSGEGAHVVTVAGRMLEVYYPLECEWDRRGHPGNAKTAELAVKVLLQVIAFCSALLFLVGIQKRRHKLLLPYVRVLGMHILFNAVELLVRAFVYNMWASAVLITLPLGIGIPYYMWVCAYSLYRKMKLSALDLPLQSHIVAHLPPQFMQDTTVLPPLPPGYGYAPPVPPTAPVKPDDLPPPYHMVVVADAAAVAQPMPGPPAMGPPPMGPPAMGPPPMGSPAMGPPPMGSPAMGPHVMGSPGMGTHAMGSPAMGSPAIGPHAMGSPAMGPHPMGPPAMGSPAIGSPAMGSPARGSASAATAAGPATGVVAAGAGAGAAAGAGPTACADPPKPLDPNMPSAV